MVKQSEAMVRINTRFPKEVKVYITKLAKKWRVGEGEAHREILAGYMKRNRIK